MRLSALLLVATLPLLAGCNGGNAQRAAEAEKIELIACRQTYPVGKSAFADLIHCELGAVHNYVQEVDPSETRAQERLAADLQDQAAAVDQGRITLQDWQSLAHDRIDKLRDAKAAQTAANEIL
jgi:hypothetical protein